ncbi:MAG: CopG family transcriptional regulator [Chloroflexota bacterium]
MAITKISVSVPEELLLEARRNAGRRGLSAYVTAGIERQVRSDNLARLNRDLDECFGPISEQDIAQAMQWLDD